MPTELTITDRGRGLDPRELSSALMDTMRRAQAQLRDTVADLTAATVGDDGPASDIVAGYRDQFPDPEAEQSGGSGGGMRDLGALEDETADYADGAEPRDTPRRPGPRPARDERDDDDDFGGSVFR